MIHIATHPLLDIRVFQTDFGSPLGELATPQEIVELMARGAAAPLCSNDEVRKAVRDLLRQGGFKPTGRSKPASEYLLKAVDQEKLSTINIAVDILNVVSLHSGLPISVVDSDRVEGLLSVSIAPAGSSYVFNQSQQTIDIGGLMCFCDAQGPCANAVKDSQRTKTSPETVRTISIIWGTNQLPGRTVETLDWYESLLTSAGAIVNHAL